MHSTRWITGKEATVSGKLRSTTFRLLRTATPFPDLRNMSNRSKSLYRGPNVKHFALVHRSVRDPKSNDPEAGERVLSEVQRGKGKVRCIESYM